MFQHTMHLKKPQMNRLEYNLLAANGFRPQRVPKSFKVNKYAPTLKCFNKTYKSTTIHKYKKALVWKKKNYYKNYEVYHNSV